MRVATVVNEQFNVLENMKNRGELRGAGLPGVDEELKRKEMDKPGVIDAVFGGWSRFSDSEQVYREILDDTPIGPQRSEFTDEKSMKVYCSLFPQSTHLSKLDLTYINGENSSRTAPSLSDERILLLDNEPQGNISRDKSPFTIKATVMGFPLASFGNTVDTSPPSLFKYESRPILPEGVEQINDDLFARKDNRFVVFNRPGLREEWPPEPVTKIHDIKEDVMF